MNRVTNTISLREIFPGDWRLLDFTLVLFFTNTLQKNNYFLSNEFPQIIEALLLVYSHLLELKQPFTESNFFSGLIRSKERQGKEGFLKGK